ncbi:MAG: protein kinase [Polyangiaceae bacterium]|nr:protein kinase [Polyangiaceae bacterium]MCL4748666.1 protein kinase [Myxococcales bacterium]
MRARINPATALLAVGRLTDPQDRAASFRQAIAALGQNMRVTGPPPLDGIDPQSLTRACQVALEAKLFEDLDWIAPGPATVALYELMMALPTGAERRELGRKVLTRLYEGTAGTFAAVATRMALGSGKALEPATMRARVSLVIDVPIGSDVDGDALALTLATRRELAERWMVRPSFAALPARRMAARILERAAREAVMRSQQGDPLPGELLGGEIVRPVRRRLLADREPLVWRHAAISRGLLASVDQSLREQIDLALDPALSPTEWRRAAVSLVATLAADPNGGLKACQRLLRSEILRKDPGIAATMVWGLGPAIETEPDAAEQLLDLLAASRRPDVAEAVAQLFAELGPTRFGGRAADMLRSVLASKLDSDPPALRAITERTLASLDRERGDGGLAESLRRAMVAFETRGARAAHDHATEAETEARAALERLLELDAHDPQALPEALALLADLDAGALESNRLADLLLLGRRPGDADASLPGMERAFDALGRWLLDAEEREIAAAWSRLGSLGNQRRLRALLHLVDTETAHGETDEASTRLRERIRRALDVLVRRVAAGPDASVHRIVCATLARACDAAVREGVAEPSDVFLLVAERLGDRHSIVTLGEASTNEDVETVLGAYASFLDPGGAAESQAESTHDTETAHLADHAGFATAARRVLRLSVGLAAGGSHRAEALRGTVLRLARSLEAVVAARGLSDIVEQSSGSSAIEEIEHALDSLRMLLSGARRRVLEQEPDAAEVIADVAPLSLLLERAVSASVPPNAEQLAAAREELLRELPTPLTLAVAGVLSRVAELPAVAPADVVAIPLGRRRAELPDWLLPRRTLGAFYVVRPLGAGGVSSVFVARRLEERHDAKAESFALKVPQFDPTTARSLSEQEFMQLFRDEAGALLSLPQHENLARFVTFDMAARPKPILVMELIRGVGLDRLVRSRSLTVERAFSYLDGILAGLEAMHSVGVGHLDVKPSNVILRDGDTPVLVDFGLSGRKLRPGCGTLEYCSPEVIGIVAEGHAPSPLAADVYAFACMAFEVLTGKPLFDAADETAILSLHLAHDGWPDKLVSLGKMTDLADVSVVLAACLRRDARARPDISDVRKALGQAGRKLVRASWPLGRTPRAEPASARP